MAAARLQLSIHALTIHIEVPEIVRGQATLERLLCPVWPRAESESDSGATTERLQGDSCAPCRLRRAVSLSALTNSAHS